VQPKSQFILPAQPVLRDCPPKGDGWLHEVKFDGYRAQLHKRGKDVSIYSRNGANFTSRFPTIAYALAHLPTRNAVIDAELVAADARGTPDFFALHGRRAKPEDVCCYAFDLLHHADLDTRSLPLLSRRLRLHKLLERADCPVLFYSTAFDDADKLLGECEKRGIEGIVSKRKDQTYRSGKCDWVKVKTKAWREANADRGDLIDPVKRTRLGW
jgi:bifunctional non-homologous end joining protein LigD